MKKTVWGLFICWMSIAAVAQGAGRIFTDNKGRSIEAEVIGYNESRNEVTIKRVGTSKTITVPVDVFSDNDRKYIREWGRGQDLLGRHLKADISRLKKQDTEHGRATSASTEVYTDHSFKIEFNNETYTAFDDLEFEYVLYYEQEHHTGSGHDVENKPGTLYHKEKITLPAREVTERMSQTIKLYTWKTYSLAPVDSKMLGIRIRLTLASSFEKPVVREFVYPDGLDNAWVEKTTDTQMRVP